MVEKAGRVDRVREDAVASVDKEDEYQGSDEKSGELRSGTNLRNVSAEAKQCTCMS